MTDRIDLDELDESTDDEPEANPGDWLWRGEGDPADEPDPEEGADSLGANLEDRVPRVPRETDGKPVGIPMASGGAGGGSTDDDPPERDDEGAAASGPHGGGADEMTLAFTYDAVKRLASPVAAFGDAAQWTDWLGIVGDVPVHVVTKFQREHALDADFFNGTGTSARERLAEIDERSMFFAERMVLVGEAGQEALAPDGWEFLPLETAATEAGWDLSPEE